MIGKYLFEHEIPHGVKSICCNGKTYSREEFVLKVRSFSKDKKKV